MKKPPDKTGERGLGEGQKTRFEEGIEPASINTRSVILIHIEPSRTMEFPVKVVSINPSNQAMLHKLHQDDHLNALPETEMSRSDLPCRI